MPKTLEDLLVRKIELKEEIAELLAASDSDFEFSDVLDAIYDEEETQDYHNLLMMFDDGNPEKLSNALEVATDAWNCFPHRSLDGFSPAEMIFKSLPHGDETPK